MKENSAFHRTPKTYPALLSALLLLICIFASVVHAQSRSSVWIPDNGNGIYSNPVLHADYSDPDVIRVGDDFYLTSSSFQEVPGLPLLQSKDLVNWTIVGHAVERLGNGFDTPQYGKGIWAPSIRHHNGEFYIYYGDPDAGIFMVKAKKTTGPWQKPVLVQQAKGMIDPCPLWDDDGNAYLVHAWAKSRAGFNSVLTVHRMNAEGTALLDTGTLVFDGHLKHPTIEGPKFYKRNGYYYIFAPAGGVKQGWQTVLRSRSLFGPYEDRIVMTQGTSTVNGPHQGAWIETVAGDSWFMHFQDMGAYGRVVHLQPMTWKNDWPVIGRDVYGKGCGEPVLEFSKPVSGKNIPPTAPQSADDFSSKTLGLQWQWNANPKESWYSLSSKKGFLRLAAMKRSENSANLRAYPAILLQKFPAPEFTSTLKLSAANLKAGDRFGFIVMGLDYSYIGCEKKGDSLSIVRVICKNADEGNAELIEDSSSVPAGTLCLRIICGDGAVCTFSFSSDDKTYQTLGSFFTAREGQWIGARIGVFCTRSGASRSGGSVDLDWIHFNENVKND
jgi:beta-xylosidase